MLARRLSTVTRPRSQPIPIPFGEWLPDLPDHSNPGALVANGVVPSAIGYEPFPSLTEITNALTARSLGFLAARDASNNIYLYAGDATKLYEAVDNVFTDQSGTTYSTAVDDVWEFALWNQQVFATNFTDVVQEIGIGLGASANFADLMTSTLKPKAKHMAVVKNFLVLGNTSDATDGHVPNRCWWSAINDPTDFDPDAATQCDFENFADGGWIQKVVGGVDYGLVFQENLIRRMTYIGAPRIWRFDRMEVGRGTPIPNSVVQHGRLVFYISEEGFMMFDGYQSTPIGSNKVDRTFWNHFDIANKTGVSAGIDPQRKLVCWAFPGSNASGNIANKIWFYRWDVQKWSECDVMVYAIARAQVQGYTLDTLDNLTTDIDDGTLETLDSDIYKGGQFRFAAFTQNNKLAYFTGESLTATLETPEVQLYPGRTAQVRRARPMVEYTPRSAADVALETALGSVTVASGDITTSLASRKHHLDGVTFGTAEDMNSDGECPVHGRSRYQRFRVTIAPSTSSFAWQHATGLAVTAEPSAPY